MLRAAIAFFLIGLLAMFLGVYNVAGMSMEIGRILLIIFVAIAIVSFIASLASGKKSSLLGLVLLLSLGATSAKASDDPTNVANRVQNAAIILDEIMSASDKAIPSSLLDRATCVAVIPNVVKAGFVIAGRHGKGLVSCRLGGMWSRPSFLELTGGSVGFQVGIKTTDVILVFIGEDAVQQFGRNNFTLGADASITAGPLGRSAEAGVDYKLTSQVYSYSRSQGLFGGVALSGTSLNPDRKVNRMVYGPALTPIEIIGKSGFIPIITEPFILALRHYSP